MARGEVDTGSVGRLVIIANESGYDAVANQSDISWAVYLDERVISNTTWSAGGNDISVGWNPNGWGFGPLMSGTFGFDFRPTGAQSVLLASGTATMNHNPDGTGSLYMQVDIGATGTTAGGPASVGVNVPVTTLKVQPNKPGTPVATRISDSQIDLTWTNSGASNGQPTANQIHKAVNGGDRAEVISIGATTSASIGGVGPNQKLTFWVTAQNAAGFSPFSDPSNIVYTTPGAPTGVTAAKNAGLDIVVNFSSTVAYVEHTHEVWHGVVAGGVTTWDGDPLATLAAGVLSYTHVAPDSAQVHVYRVRSRAGALGSAYVESPAVQLLVAPNKPTVPAMPAVANKAAALDFTWVHNPIDSTPQSAYEFDYSTDGGTTWSTTGKVVSAAALHTIAASTYAADVALTTRVRTWGSATTGGSEDTGASPWSDLRTVTYKTVPTATVTAPANGSTINESTVRATVGFAQPEAATFVSAQLELLQGATLLETLNSSVQVGIVFATPAQNGLSYTVRARVQDSNGLWSAWASSTFSVTYLAPVPAVLSTQFLPDNGFGQINITIAAPGEGESAAATVTITRTIDGVTETLVTDYPAAAEMTFLDTTATTHGTNTYNVTTKTALGAQLTTSALLVTEECRRAYLSKGAGFDDVVVFGGNLQVDMVLGVASDTIQAAGRTKPIGLYGVETTKQLKVNSFIFEGFGSSITALEAILLMPGKACFRDASGRRVFGSVKGSVNYKKTTRGDLSFTMTETS